MSTIPIGSVERASKRPSYLFCIEIRLRNYVRRIDRDILFYKMQQDQSQIECIVSYHCNEGMKTKYRSPHEFKILIDTQNTKDNMRHTIDVYIWMNKIIRNIVGSEQQIRDEDLRLSSDLDKLPEIRVRKSWSKNKATKWATNSDYRPRFTKSFKENTFHKSHGIRKWAIENINEPIDVALNKIDKKGLDESYLIEYLQEKNDYYNNTK